MTFSSLGLQADPNPDLNWKKIEKPASVRNIKLAPLQKGEALGLFETAAYAKGIFFWTGERKENDKTQSGLIVRHSNGKADFYITPEWVRGMTVYNNTLLLRFHKSLAQMDPETGEIQKSWALPAISGRQPIVLWNNKLGLLENNRLTWYDWPEKQTTLKKTGESANLPMGATQRVVSCGNGLHLWSSYGGAKVISLEQAVSQLGTVYERCQTRTWYRCRLPAVLEGNVRRRKSDHR